MDIKPIETEYDGYRFRSRLEARWAVFFDDMKIKYQYEIEGFTGCHGTPYLPDFYFPDYDIYGEVKGTNEQLFECQEKISGAIDFNTTPVSKGLLLLGPIPYNPDQRFNYDIRGYYLYWSEGINLGQFCFQSLHEYGRILLLNTYEENTYSCWPELPSAASINMWVYDYGENNFSLLDASLTHARSARFEYGEHG